MASDQVWEDLNPFRMDQDAINEVIRKAPGCTVCYTKRDGQPVGVWVSHAVIDGELYVTTTENRGKTASWRRDPRTSVTFAVPGIGSVTVLGRVTLSDDPALRHSFLAALADRMSIQGDRRDQWFRHMDTEGRVTGHITPERFVSFDERKLAW